MSAESDEKKVWDLLTRNFYWETPEEFGISLYDVTEHRSGPTRLQVFEVVVAAIFARVRPDYVWSVTPNRPDGGLDFVGKNRFLHDETLGISAAITVGGQCKMRSDPKNLVHEVSGSLVNMMMTVKPTFFVVALSSRVSQERIETAVARVQTAFNLDCHILDRDQIEGLMVEHLSVVGEVVSQALSAEDAAEVLAYFHTRDTRPLEQLVEVAKPANVLAGEPFQVQARVTVASLAGDSLRVWWRPTSGVEAAGAILLGPPGAERPEGGHIASGAGRENPIKADVNLELVTHGVGPIELGEIAVGQAGSQPEDDSFVEIGSTESVENTRPRFYEQPFGDHLSALLESYGHAAAKGFESVGVVGGGGSGKTRLAEEFALEQRRRGALLATARQAQSLDEPHRLVADLFHALVHVGRPAKQPADQVVETLALYDPDLAACAEVAIHSVFGSRSTGGGGSADQLLISTLLVLIAARSRELPVVIHLQDLHWCTAESLEFLGRLIWQLAQVQGDIAGSRVFLLLEGRSGESFASSSWSSEAFESFLRAVGCPVIRCEPLQPSHALEFTRRLFEDRFSSHRHVPEQLLSQQDELVDRIQRSAGGNPFHTLAQTQLLRQRGLIRRNPRTGLFFLVNPGGSALELPPTVAESIIARWRYLREHANDVAVLLWAAAISEDSIPMALFEHLRRRLAPNASVADINNTEMMIFTGSDERLVEFRHENYVRVLRRLEVGEDERASVIGAFNDWFDSLVAPAPIEEFRAGRTKLLFTPPRYESAQELFARSRDSAKARGDSQLERRIQIASLDAFWAQDVTDPLGLESFLRCADEEIDLIRALREIDVANASRRVELLRKRLRHRIATLAGRSAEIGEQVELRRVTSDVLHAQIQFVDQQPGAATLSAEACLGEVGRWLVEETEFVEHWRTLEMECLQALAVAKATSGEAADAFEIADRAAASAAGMDTLLADHVMGSYATLLSATDPVAAEELLRRRLERIVPINSGADAWSRLTIFLAMALLQKDDRGVGVDASDPNRDRREAKRLLERVSHRSYRLGQYPDAGASALMLGIVSAIDGDGEDVDWFARAVAAAARGRQLETLWRAHLNLATSVTRRNKSGDSASEHASAALELMERSLAFYSEPERSPRFEKLRVALIRALQILLRYDHPHGAAAIGRLPSLAHAFDDEGALVLEGDWRGPRDYQRIEVGSVDYFSY